MAYRQFAAFALKVHFLVPARLVGVRPLLTTLLLLTANDRHCGLMLKDKEEGKFNRPAEVSAGLAVAVDDCDTERRLLWLHRSLLCEF